MSRVLVTFILFALCGLNWAEDEGIVLLPTEFKPIRELGECFRNQQSDIIKLKHIKDFTYRRRILFIIIQTCTLLEIYPSLYLFLTKHILLL